MRTKLEEKSRRGNAPREGFEPPTGWLTATCSTPELPGKDLVTLPVRVVSVQVEMLLTMIEKGLHAVPVGVMIPEQSLSSFNEF